MYTNSVKLDKGIFKVQVKFSGRDYGTKFIARKANKGVRWESKPLDTEREAKIAYDKKCIDFGLEPRYIFKRTK